MLSLLRLGTSAKSNVWCEDLALFPFFLPYVRPYLEGLQSNVEVGVLPQIIAELRDRHCSNLGSRHPANPAGCGVGPLCLGNQLGFVILGLGFASVI